MDDFDAIFDDDAVDLDDGEDDVAVEDGDVAAALRKKRPNAEVSLCIIEMMVMMVMVRV